MDELTQSYDHLKLAAAHVAGGTAEQVTPTYDKARNVAARGWYTTRSAFAPMYEQIREGAANARREREVKRNKWPVVVGLAAAGIAAGAAGAMVARRRKLAAEWDEYEPMPSLEESPYGAEKGAAPTTHKVTAGAASVADTVSERAGKLADSLHEKARPSGTEKPAGRAPASGTGAGNAMSGSAGGDTFAPFAEEPDPSTSPKPGPKR